MDLLTPIHSQCNTKSSGVETVSTPRIDLETLAVRKITALRDVLADAGTTSAEKCDRIRELVERDDV